MSGKPGRSGRPSVYTAEIAAEICARLGEGESLIKICTDVHMPDESTVRGWALNNAHNFFPEYTRARQVQAMRWAEEVLEIADDGSNDWMEKNDPDNPGYVLNGEHSQRSRMRLDTRKWLLSKVLPKIYGDKLAIGGDADSPLTVTVRRIVDKSGA